MTSETWFATRRLAVACALLCGLAACDSGSDEGTPDVGGSDVVTADTVADVPGGEDVVLTPDVTPDSAGPADTRAVDTAPEVFVPGGCCESDDDCAPGEQCIGLAIGSPGVCVPAPSTGACYERRDCADDEVCTGGRATICVMSSLPDLGTCESMPQHCCWDDGDCDEGRECQGPNEATWGPGECLLVPEIGYCYGDGHCPENTYCIGAHPCGCMVDCYWSGPGVCVPLDGTCCFSHDDCDEGEHCSGGTLGERPGNCKPALDDGTCWGPADCASNEVCEGAQMCQCDADCDMEDVPGTCVAPTVCCAEDTECPDGTTCAHFPEVLHLEGVCKPAQTAGMCWDSDDCLADQVCLGAIPCRCGQSTAGDGCDIPGECVDKEPYGCCATDADCTEGRICALGATCVDPLESGQCWSDHDCSGTEHCNGLTVCPCDKLCTAPTAPGTCQ